jgi:hypothetical protein
MLTTLTAILGASAVQAAPLVDLGTNNSTRAATTSAAGGACDLSKCQCDGVSLAALQGHVYSTPPDDEGYSYKMSFCDTLSAAELPSGCQQYAEAPAVVKYKASNPADCIEIGSTGPCAQGECGMTGQKSAQGIDVTYTYTYGCVNRFTLHLQVRCTVLAPEFPAANPTRPDLTVTSPAHAPMFAKSKVETSLHSTVRALQGRGRWCPMSAPTKAAGSALPSVTCRTSAASRTSA